MRCATPYLFFSFIYLCLLILCRTPVLPLYYSSFFFPFPFIVFPFMVNDAQLSIFPSSFQDPSPIFSFYHYFSFFFFLFHLHCFLLYHIRLLMYHFSFLVLSFVMIFFFPLPYTCFARTFVVHAVHLL